MNGSLYSKQAVSAQEKRNHELANTNSHLRRKIGEVQTQESNMKVRNADLEAELVAVRVFLKATRRESVLKLERMETIMDNAMLSLRWSTKRFVMLSGTQTTRSHY